MSVGELENIASYASAYKFVEMPLNTIYKTYTFLYTHIRLCMCVCVLYVQNIFIAEVFRL